MRRGTTKTAPPAAILSSLLLVGALAGCSENGERKDAGPIRDASSDGIPPDRCCAVESGTDTLPPSDAAADTAFDAAADTAFDAAADQAADAAADQAADAAADTASDAAADTASDAAADQAADAAADATADQAVEAATDQAAGDLGPVDDVFPGPPDSLPDGLFLGDGPIYGCGPAPLVGCCRGNVLYYCDSSGVLISVDCAASPKCGWDAFYALYDCGTAGEEDPTATHPLSCTF